MNELEVTWKRTLIVWWALTWRAVVFIVPVGFVVGVLLAVIFGVMGADMEASAPLANVIGFFLGGVMYIWILNIVLKKKLGEFRIALLPVASQEM